MPTKRKTQHKVPEIQCCFGDFRCQVEKLKHPGRRFKSTAVPPPQNLSYSADPHVLTPICNTHKWENTKSQSNSQQCYFTRKQERFLLHPAGCLSRKLTPSGSALQHTALTNSFVSSSLRSLSRTLLTVSNLNVSSVFERPL